GAGSQQSSRDWDRRVLLAGSLEPPRLGVLVLAEVHDTAHRRARLGRHLDEVEFLLAGGFEGLGDRHDPELLAIGADDADLTNPDAFVDTDVLACLTDRRAPR